jgi:transcriptional regulator with XRE-family HTH domain
MSAWRRYAFAQEIGSRIARLREQKRWSQLRLATEIGVTREEVSRWECGRNRPHISLLASLADALRTTTDYLLRGRP